MATELFSDWTQEDLDALLTLNVEQFQILKAMVIAERNERHA